jgi:hypothetical protein
MTAWREDYFCSPQKKSPGRKAGALNSQLKGCRSIALTEQLQ